MNKKNETQLTTSSALFASISQYPEIDSQLSEIRDLYRRRIKQVVDHSEDASILDYALRTVRHYYEAQQAATLIPSLAILAHKHSTPDPDSPEADIPGLIKLAAAFCQTAATFFENGDPVRGQISSYMAQFAVNHAESTYEKYLKERNAAGGKRSGTQNRPEIEKYREEYLKRNPTHSHSTANQQAADKFGVPKSTIEKWPIT